MFGVESGCGAVVFVDEAAEPVSTFDRGGSVPGWGQEPREGREQCPV